MTVRREQTVSAFLSGLCKVTFDPSSMYETLMMMCLTALHHLHSEEIDMQETTAQKQFLDGVEDAANCTVKLIKIISAG